MFTGEMFVTVNYEQADVFLFKEDWMQKVQSVFEEAALAPLSNFGEGQGVRWTQQGGKQGKHTEYFGYLLTEMQYLQRSYPNNVW